MPTVREGVRLASAGMGRRYFSSETFDFLQDLELFNERSWFQANKERYEIHVREPLLQFIEDLREPLHAAVSSHLVCDSRKVGARCSGSTGTPASPRTSRPTRPRSPPASTRPAGMLMRPACTCTWSRATVTSAAGSGCRHLRRSWLCGRRWWIDPGSGPRSRRRLVAPVGVGGVAADGAAGLQRRRPTHRGSASYVVCRQPPAHREQVCGPRFLDLYVGRSIEAAPLLAWQCDVLGLGW